MPWDVFICHASEDKPDVVVPLAAALEEAGISVWLDKERIKLGDSLRRSIDHGLNQCRYGIVVLSPSFFAKRWPQKELDALVGMETSDGRKRVLPLVHRLSINDVAVHSPLLSGVLCAFWPHGIPTVVQQIVEVVRGNPSQVREIDPSSAKVSADFKSPALLLLQDGRAQLLDSEEVAVTGREATITLLTSDSEDTAFLASIQQADRIGFAFGTSAFLGSVAAIRQSMAGGRETWEVSLRLEESHDAPFEMAYNNYSADDLAEMRARRILLNDRLTETKDRASADLSDVLLESFVSGQDAFVRIPESPLPRLYARLGDDRDRFLTAARLFCVLMLRLSNTVDQVLKLDLNLSGEGTLTVVFRGRRARRYSNVDPVVVSVEGECDLTRR